MSQVLDDFLILLEIPVNKQIMHSKDQYLRLLICGMAENAKDDERYHCANDQ